MPKGPKSPSYSDTNANVISSALDNQAKIQSANNATAGSTAAAIRNAESIYNPQAAQANENLGNYVNNYSVNPEDYSDKSSAIRQALEGSLTRDINAGYSLTPQQQYLIEQQTRANQAARGNSAGTSAGFQETLNALDYGNKLYNQRIQNAGQFLSSGQSANDTFQGLLARLNAAKQQGVTNAGNYINQTQNATSGIRNAISQGNTLDVNQVGNQTGNAYGTNAGIYKTQADNYQSPWSAAASTIANIF